MPHVGPDALMPDTAPAESVNLCLHPELAATIGLDGGYSGVRNYTDVTGGTCIDVVPTGLENAGNCSFWTQNGTDCTQIQSRCGFCKKTCNRC